MLENIKNHIKKFKAVEFIAVILAVSLQIQVTLFVSGDYLGLRASLADILLPFIGAFVIYSLILGKSSFPEFSINHAILWIISLVAVMSAALLNGYIVNGFLSSWAFVNKYVGFFILLSYFLLGGWLAANARDVRYLYALFMSVFTGFFVACMFLSAIILFLQYLAPFPLWFSNYPWDGFMYNRNAFMACFVLAFIFIIWSYSNSKTLISPWVRGAFWLSVPIFFVFNDSRAGWIVAIILFMILLLKEPVRRIKSIAPVLLVGVLIAYGSYYVTKSDVVLQSMQFKNLLAVMDNRLADNGAGDLVYFGDEKRYLAVDDGLELYRAHDPFVGAGLGAYKPFQIEKRGEFVDVMDFTALWLLVETGAAGLLTFIAFFIACAWSLYKRGYVLGGEPYHRSMLTFLIVFALISVLHELMYTRFLWFAMGLALGVVACKNGGRYKD